MTEGMMRCMRCKGRKRIFKVMGGYSFIDTGGVKVDCPMCLGEGKIKTLQATLESIEQELNIETDEKDSQNVKENIVSATRAKTKSSKSTSGKASKVST